MKKCDGCGETLLTLQEWENRFRQECEAFIIETKKLSTEGKLNGGLYRGRHGHLSEWWKEVLLWSLWSNRLEAGDVIDIASTLVENVMSGEPIIIHPTAKGEH